MFLTRLSFALPLLAVTLLAGCDPRPGHVLPVEGADTCGIAPFLHLIGEPESTLSGLALGQNVRIIHHDQAVTMDYSAERKNIFLDQHDRIQQMSCG